MTNAAHTQYLAYAAAKSVGVLVVKDWSAGFSGTVHKKPVNGVCFGADAKLIASVSDDRALKLWA